MSQRYLLDIFPSLVKYAKSSAFSWLLPSDDICTSLHSSYLPLTRKHWVSVNLPLLLLFAGLGAFIGVLGFGRLRREKITMWSLAFLFFGCMNITALLCHCVFVKPHRGDSSLWHTFYSLDVAFTSISGMAILLATLEDLAVLGPALARNQLLLYIPMALALSFQHTIPFMPEALYIGVVGVAAVTLLLFVVVPAFLRAAGIMASARATVPASSLPEVSQQEAELLERHGPPPSLAQIERNQIRTSVIPPLLTVLCGAGVFVLAVFPLDALLCRLTGWGGGVLYFSFLGCDIAFLGLRKYVLASRRLIPAREKTA